MKKQKPAGKNRRVTVEHITGQTRKVNPQKVAAGVREPEALRK